MPSGQRVLPPGNDPAIGWGNRKQPCFLPECGVSQWLLDLLRDAGWLSELALLNLAKNPELNNFSSVVAGLRRALESLDLTACRMGGADLTSLLECGPFERLGQLSLGSNPLGDTGAMLLASTKALPALRILDLRNTGLTGEGLFSLASESLLAGLERLNLSSQKPLAKWRIQMNRANDSDSSTSVGEVSILEKLLHSPAAANLRQIRAEGRLSLLRLMLGEGCALNSRAIKDFSELIRNRQAPAQEVIRQPVDMGADHRKNQALMNWCTRPRTPPPALLQPASVRLPDSLGRTGDGAVVAQWEELVVGEEPANHPDPTDPAGRAN